MGRVSIRTRRRAPPGLASAIANAFVANCEEAWRERFSGPAPGDIIARSAASEERRQKAPRGTIAGIDSRERATTRTRGGWTTPVEQALPDDLAMLWQRVSDEIRSSLPPSTYKLWLEPLRPVLEQGQAIARDIDRRDALSALAHRTGA